MMEGMLIVTKQNRKPSHTRAMRSRLIAAAVYAVAQPDFNLLIIVSGGADGIIIGDIGVYKPQEFKADLFPKAHLRTGQFRSLLS